MKSKYSLTFGFTEISAVKRHPFYLMPYPVLKEKSDSTLEFNDFVTNNGQRKSRQLDVPLDVITHYVRAVLTNYESTIFFTKFYLFTFLHSIMFD